MEGKLPKKCKQAGVAILQTKLQYYLDKKRHYITIRGIRDLWESASVSPQGSEEDLQQAGYLEGLRVKWTLHYVHTYASVSLFFSCCSTSVL